MAAATWAFATRDDGDFSVTGDTASLAARRADFLAGEWTSLHQVHGARVVVVDHPGAHAGVEADAAVTDRPGAVLAVHTADCVPVLFRSGTAVIGAAHVGWRGLVAGVVEATIDAMTSLGARRIVAMIGPHIRPRCYEFGAAALDDVAARRGDAVRASTASDTPALDLLAGVRTALADRPQVDRIHVEGGCTACEPERYFSHRARGDRGRHAAAIVICP